MKAKVNFSFLFYVFFCVFLFLILYALLCQNPSHEKCDQSVVECETVSLDDDIKKFKIININQATNLDGQGNKFELKKQLIEIDKLLINPQNVTSSKNFSSNFGVWHQVNIHHFRPFYTSRKTFNMWFLKHSDDVNAIKTEEIADKSVGLLRFYW